MNIILGIIYSITGIGLVGTFIWIQWFADVRIHWGYSFACMLMAAMHISLSYVLLLT